MFVRRHSRGLLPLVLAVVALSVNACKPDAAVQQGAVIGRGTKEAATPTLSDSSAPPEQTGITVAGTGAISGAILFKGKVPARTIDTTMDPACDIGGKGKLPVEQFVVNNGRLANVFLYIKSGPPEAMVGGNVPAQPVILDQQHCQYVPHVIGVQAGGFVEFRNSDPTMHNVHTNPTDVGNQTIDISMGARGQPVAKQFLKPELMIPVRCNNHPWMNAFINVSATPYFAVSDANGMFQLRGLPEGEYTIAAVHEKLGEKTMHVTVAAHSVAQAEFGFAQ